MYQKICMHLTVSTLNLALPVEKFREMAKLEAGSTKNEQQYLAIEFFETIIE